MTLLGSVQTYFGVLLTLAVLQIFYRGKSSENYFLKLVEYLGQETLDNVERLSKSLINQKKKEIKKIKSVTTRERLAVSLSKVDTVKLIIHSDLEKRLKLINKNETPQFVALYSLLFGLIIMFVDPFWELFHSNFMIGFVLYYLTLSFAFTFVQWLRNYINFNLIKKKGRKFVKDKIGVPYFLFYTIFICMISVITFTVIPMKSIWWRVFITFILFFSMGLCENFYQTKEYNRQFIIVHVLMIFLLSLFGGFLYDFHPFSSYASFWMEKGTDIQILRMLLVLYMVLNLIFVPLITICVKHYLWKRDSMRNLENVCLLIEAED